MKTNGYTKTLLDNLRASFAARDAQIAEMIRNGRTYADCATEFGLSKQRVEQIAYSRGVAGEAVRRRQEQRFKTVTALIDSGRSVIAIADECGLSEPTIRSIARKHGKPFSKTITQNSLMAVCLLLTTNESVKSINAKSGLSVGVVNQMIMRIKALGFQPKRYGRRVMTRRKP